MANVKTKSYFCNLFILRNMIKDKEISLWKVYSIRLSIMLLLLAISRWLLFVFNVGNFPDVTVADRFRLFFVGMRFDLWTLVVANIPILIGYSMPFKFRYNKVYCKTIDILFVVLNWFAVALNLVDVIYYRYIDKRMTSELTEFFHETDDNQGSLMMHFIHDFWFIVLFMIITALIIIVLAKRTRVKKEVIYSNKTWYISRTLMFLFIIFWSVIAMRGGFQLRPTEIITAARYTNTQNMVLVLNTPFTIVRGSSGDVLEKKTYFDDDKIESLYSPIHKELKTNMFIDSKAEGYNILVIILESFGQEMVRYYNESRDESVTPFLDSLLCESLTFDGMANGRRSIDALTSILSGVPSLMVTDYASSRYAANHLEGFGKNLKRHGYHTAFFHGGNNGSMNFDASATSAGFDNYFGRNEYDNDSDYDGTWGISDMPFLQFTASKLNEMRKPFAAGVFTLSSHHPYTIPQGYTVPEGRYKSEFEKTVRYADDALRLFFETVSQYSWYDSTIFVITGDHVSPEHYFEKYRNGYGQYEVPLAFFSPKKIEALRTDIMAQQTDVGVSLLAALGYDEPIFSFGRNVFDSIQEPCFSSFVNEVYQYSDGDYMLQSDGDLTIGVYDLRNDKELKNNLYSKENANEWNELETKFHLRLQQYNNRMISNKLFIK